MKLGHINIEKTRLLACESIYWVNMNIDTAQGLKNITKYHIYHWNQSKLTSLPLITGTIFAF